MIKNIIFDLGKVLIDYNFDLFFQACSLDSKKFDFKDDISLILKFDSGSIDRKIFYQEMKAKINFSLSQSDFEKAWCSPFWENTEMIDFAQKLASNYNVFILSNTDEIHFPYIWQTFPDLHIFTQNLMLSYQLGCVKPDPKIYSKALSMYKLNAEECIFIDDKMENVKAAEKFGIRSILHLSNKKTIENVSNHLT